jgi:hypothetical protein
MNGIVVDVIYARPIMSRRSYIAVHEVEPYFPANAIVFLIPKPCGSPVNFADLPPKVFDVARLSNQVIVVGENAPPKDAGSCGAATF